MLWPISYLPFLPSTRNHIPLSTYRTAGLGIVDAQCGHGPDDGQHSLQHVAVDDGLVLQALFWGVAVLVDDPVGAHPPLSRPGQLDHRDWESGGGEGS